MDLSPAKGLKKLFNNLNPLSLNISPSKQIQRFSQEMKSRLLLDLYIFIGIMLVTILLSIAAVIFMLVAVKIINNSAYVTPQFKGLNFFDPGGGFADPSSCPINGGHVLLGSYNPNHENDSAGGHGSTYYWKVVYSGGCYTIPQESSCINDPDGNRCSGSDACPYYGFAADIVGGAAGAPVILPLVNGVSMKWNCRHQSFGGLWQPGTSVDCDTTDGSVHLTLTHTVLNSNSSGSNMPSGTIVATLVDQGGNTHLHMEARVGGSWVRPENYFCGNK